MPTFIRPGAQVPGAGNVNFDPFIASGGVYVTAAIPCQTMGTVGIGANRFYMAPHIMKGAGVITAVSFQNTANTPNVRVGVYSLNGATMALLQQSASTSIGSSAVHDVDITDINYVDGDAFMVGIISDATLTMRSMATGLMVGSDYPMAATGFENTGNLAGYRCDFTYGALEEPPVMDQIAETMPILALKISS